MRFVLIDLSPYFVRLSQELRGKDVPSFHSYDPGSMEETSMPLKG